MFFMARQCVACNTWVLNLKVRVTLKGQLKTIVLCICLDLSRPYFAHSVKDYKIIWYKCFHNVIVCRTQHLGPQFKGQRHT